MIRRELNAFDLGEYYNIKGTKPLYDLSHVLFRYANINKDIVLVEGNTILTFNEEYKQKVSIFHYNSFIENIVYIDLSSKVDAHEFFRCNEDNMFRKANNLVREFYSKGKNVKIVPSELKREVIEYMPKKEKKKYFKKNIAIEEYCLKSCGSSDRIIKKSNIVINYNDLLEYVGVGIFNEDTREVEEVVFYQYDNLYEVMGGNFFKISDETKYNKIRKLILENVGYY